MKHKGIIKTPKQFIGAIIALTGIIIALYAIRRKSKEDKDDEKVRRNQGAGGFFLLFIGLVMLFVNFESEKK